MCRSGVKVNEIIVVGVQCPTLCLSLAKRDNWLGGLVIGQAESVSTNGFSYFPSGSGSYRIENDLLNLVASNLAILHNLFVVSNRCAGSDD